MVVVNNASVGGMTKPRPKPVSIETYGESSRAGDGRPTASSQLTITEWAVSSGLPNGNIVTSVRFTLITKVAHVYYYYSLK